MPPPAAEPRPDVSEPTPLTARALDQLDAQVADAERGSHQHVCTAPADVRQGSVVRPLCNNTSMSNKDGTRATLESCAATKGKKIKMIK